MLGQKGEINKKCNRLTIGSLVGDPSTGEWSKERSGNNHQEPEGLM